MAKVRATTTKPTQKRRPALTPEAREQQLISLAVDLVEQRLIDGTASSQETTHFLKLATQKYRIETEILKSQKEMIEAKTETLKSQKRMEGLYEEAIKAFRNYNGQGDQDEH